MNHFISVILWWCLVPGLLGQVVKDEGFVIDDSSVPFVYEVKAEIPAPEEKLAGYLSADFANAGDEFAQHAMRQNRPVIQKRIDAAKAAPLRVVRCTQIPLRIFDIFFNTQAL